MAQPHRPLGEVLDPRQRWLLVLSLMLALFVGALDQTVVSTATPKIVADLGGFGLLSWLFTTYMLSSTVVVPLVGKLSDIYGRKPFLLTGIIVFMVASAACGAAPSMLTLIIFRAFQGIGGGMIFAAVFATIGDLFPPAERVKYMGLFTGTFSLASIIGPFAGGLLTDNAGWRWVFYINLPFGLIALPAIWFNLPKRIGGLRPKIDFAGAVWLSLSSVLLLLALVWGGRDYPWRSVEIVSIFAASAVFLVLFLVQEARHPEPMLPLHLFRNPIFLIANLIVFTLGMAMFGALAYLPTFVQTALGASATSSGVITIPQSLGVLFASVVGGQVIGRVGHYKWQTTFGTLLILASMILLMTQLDVGIAKWHISAFMVVLGLGFGLVLPTMSLVVQNAVSYQYLGVASSASQFFRQIGGVVGTAIFGAVLASSYHSAFIDNVSANDRTAIVQGAGEQTFARFDDPTLALDKRTYGAVQAKVKALPGGEGETILARLVGAQREAVAIAMRHIFTAAAAIAILCVAFSLLLRELPLRRDFKPVTVEGAGESLPPQAPPAAAPPDLRPRPGLAWALLPRQKPNRS